METVRLFRLFMLTSSKRPSIEVNREAVCLPPWIAILADPLLRTIVSDMSQVMSQETVGTPPCMVSKEMNEKLENEI